MSRRKIRQLVGVLCCAVSLSCMQTAARADVIGAEQFINTLDRQATLDRIDAVLARSDVQRELERYGVDSAEASERVAALNDQELMLLTDKLEELPAGGSLLAVVGVTFIVILILELVGVIDIFKKI
ncbi:MAG TPA: PA2779 family protein [Gammaproteobacteria bacterium]